MPRTTRFVPVNCTAFIPGTGRATGGVTLGSNIAKYICGVLMLIALVKPKCPNPSNRFVATGVHCHRGSAALVDITITAGPPAVPFVPLNTRLAPDRVRLLITGFDDALTRNVPNGRLPRSHASPGPGVSGKILVVVDTPIPLLNILNVSPGTSVPPRLVMTNLVAGPSTKLVASWSFVPAALFNFN